MSVIGIVILCNFLPCIIFKLFFFPLMGKVLGEQECRKWDFLHIKNVRWISWRCLCLFLLPAHVYFFCKNKLVSSIIVPKRIIQLPEVPLLGLWHWLLLDFVLEPTAHWEHWCTQAEYQHLTAGCRGLNLRRKEVVDLYLGIHWCVTWIMTVGESTQECV